jgi:hypothetical protein
MTSAPSTKAIPLSVLNRPGHVGEPYDKNYRWAGNDDTPRPPKKDGGLAKVALGVRLRAGPCLEQCSPTFAGVPPSLPWQPASADGF